MLKRLLRDLTISRGLAIFIVITLTATMVLAVFHFYWGTQKVKEIEAAYRHSLSSKPPADPQKPEPTRSVSSSSEQADAHVSALDSIKQLIPPELRDHPMLQKQIEVMESDSFQEAVKTRNPQNTKEYMDLLEEHGVKGLSEIDVNKELADAYNSMLQKYHAETPSKNPEDEDEAMTKRFGEALKEHRLIEGTTKMMMDKENVIWISARFKGDMVAFNEWWLDVFAASELDDSAAGGTSMLSDDDSFAIPVAETSDFSPDDAQTEVSGELPSDISPRDSESRVETEKVVPQVSPSAPALPTSEALETILKERFDRAMDTLERYGTEEGLRRLREADPELARQMEQRHNRQDRESAPEGIGEHE